jgi:two-component system sensor histidine kinase RegB
MKFDLIPYDEFSYKDALKLIFRLRNIAITSQLVVVGLVLWILKFENSVLPFLYVTATLILINAFVSWRINQKWKVLSIEIAINLVVDILGLAFLLYFSGGATNPLVSLFIIPVAISAVFLPAVYIFSLVLLTSLLYSFLMYSYIPLPSIGSKFGGDFNLHIVGMYVNFIFSAIIIAMFVLTLARNMRKQQQELALAKEQQVRNKHVVESGLLAAHAAHKINTPLSTIRLLADGLLELSPQLNKQYTDDIKEIQSQINYCKKQLQVLQVKTSRPDDDKNTESDIKEVINNTVNSWAQLHPEIELNLELDLDNQIPFTDVNSFTQTLLNLIDNAAEASLSAKHSKVNVNVKHCDTNLVIDIDDFGDGLSDYQLSQLGTEPYSSKPDGMGIGLLLSHSSLEHLGGHIMLSNHKEFTNKNGIRARIYLPLKEYKHV